MSRPAMTSEPVTGLSRNSGRGVAGTFNSGLSASELNAFRISAVMDRLNIHLQSFNSNPVEFFNLCLSLSRGIDFAIANHEIPTRYKEFPSLMKQVCQNKNDTHLQAAIMVLMISVKSACQNGWFSDGDSKELGNLAKQIASYFGSAPDLDAGPSCSLSVIFEIMSRFYPKLKMGHMFVLLEVKTGFDAYVSDFQISKNLKCSPGDKIRLFVAQTDNIETSSCLVTPAKVNFLLNGKGVEKRNNLAMDTGPQLPTIVTPVLKYGSNLLQAVGDFNGNYIIAVAFMSELPNPDISCLQDYEQHTPATVDADTEVIEGASRVSLNCPISFKRIKTPVKGHSCKHFQCFDFDNFVGINSSTPTWRCPTCSCNQFICFSDLRIDQKMVKVLKEVEANVSNIIISSDGSWTAVMESDDTVMKSADNTGQVEGNVLDLTLTDDLDEYETQDRKHPSLTQAAAAAANMNNDNDFWSGMYTSTFGPSNAQPNEVEALHHNTFVPQSGPTDAMQLQQYQFGNAASVSNEYGRFPSLPRYITRTPTAVQALPAQTTPTSVLQRGSTNRLQVPPSAPNLTRTFADPRQVSPMSSSPLIQQNSQYPSARQPHQNGGFPDPNSRVSPSPGSMLRHGGGQQSVNRLCVDTSRAVPVYPWNSNNISTPPPADQRGSSNNNQADMSWRPPGRMRGALSGQAYSDYFNQIISRPNQQAQAARPIRPPNSMGSDVLPNASSGMQ